MVGVVEVDTDRRASDRVQQPGQSVRKASWSNRVRHQLPVPVA